ncbi:MAG: Pectate lyase superfamily protein [Lentisphaerae bacterium ADurb.BinA184]|nr:MAG: Pectate lyase superfamily protein [Lentisphaerae bacterium ADurb.BinA184]
MQSSPAGFSTSVSEYGAKGDGTVDDTPAIQAAIAAAAAAGGGTVWIPPGRYGCAHIQVPSFVCLAGLPTWSYHHFGATELRLNTSEAKCLIDLTGSEGARVSGLALNGNGLGTGVMAVYMDGSKRQREDTFFVEDTRIAGFTGDAIHVDRAFTLTVQRCMVIFNQGHGLTYNGWDGWIRDNIFNNNHGWGIYGRPWNCSMTITGNRIEWNRMGGIRLARGGHYQINSNYIDRSGGPGIQLDAGEPEDRPHGRAKAHSITGNVLHRNGALADPGSDASCHIRLEYQHGVTCTGNTMTTGRNDDPTQGQLSPSFGIVYRELRDSVLANNVWPHGVTRQFLVDRGDNDATVIVRDNPGRLCGAEMRDLV